MTIKIIDLDRNDIAELEQLCPGITAPRPGSVVVQRKRIRKNHSGFSRHWWQMDDVINKNEIRLETRNRK